MKINTKILKGLKEAQEPEITDQQVIEALNSAGFGVMNDVNGDEIIAGITEIVGYTEVTAEIELSKSSRAGKLVIKLQMGKYAPENEVIFRGGTYHYLYADIIRRFSNGRVKPSFLKQELRKIASSFEKITDVIVR